MTSGDIDFDYILFGGTFDPPHIGHLAMVKSAQLRFPKAAVVVIPSWAPPVSSSTKKNVTTDFADRLAMTVIAFDEWENVTVSAMEEDIGGTSYSVETIQEFLKDHESSRVAWMMGYDQFAKFFNWKEPKTILKMVSLLVAKRPACGPEPKNYLQEAEKLSSNLGFKPQIASTKEAVFQNENCAIVFLPEAPPDVSSSNLRADLINGAKRCEDTIPSGVLQYISDAELYHDITTGKGSI